LIAEIEINGSEVIWHRMGIDAGDTNKDVGITVKWLKPHLTFRFNKADYDQFRQQLISIADNILT
jgi:hypothetical protein